MRIRIRQQPHIPLSRVHRDINRAIARFGSAKVPKETMTAVWECEPKDVDVKIFEYATANKLAVNLTDKEAIFFKERNEA